MNNLKEFGYDDLFYQARVLHQDLVVGRIISQYNHIYRIITEQGEFRAEVCGKFRYESFDSTDYPVIGDFVLCSLSSDGNALIQRVLERKSSFLRKSAGTVKSSAQVVAANIDTIFICMALNNDFNLRRLERYLAIAWNSNTKPIIVLTKSDLAEDLERQVAEVEGVAFGVDIICTSYKDNNIKNKLLSLLKIGETATFIGSSGVGKSTLINCLAGREIFSTGSLRDDDRGKHTTTNRELIRLDEGILLIDTPGMRELGILSDDLSKTFSDIEKLSINCRFGDCTHTSEPGCAVLEAIQNGELDESRLKSYLKLEREARYQEKNSRLKERQKSDRMLQQIGGVKNLKKFIKEKNRQKGR